MTEYCDTQSINWYVCVSVYEKPRISKSIYLLDPTKQPTNQASEQSDPWWLGTFGIPRQWQSILLVIVSRKVGQHKAGLDTSRQKKPCKYSF